MYLLQFDLKIRYELYVLSMTPFDSFSIQCLLLQKNVAKLLVSMWKPCGTSQFEAHVDLEHSGNVSIPGACSVPLPGLGSST